MWVKSVTARLTRSLVYYSVGMIRLFLITTSIEENGSQYAAENIAFRAQVYRALFF
jgi:hypothetical protein